MRPADLLERAVDRNAGPGDGSHIRSGALIKQEDSYRPSSG